MYPILFWVFFKTPNPSLKNLSFAEEQNTSKIHFILKNLYPRLVLLLHISLIFNKLIMFSGGGFLLFYFFFSIFCNIVKSESISQPINFRLVSKQATPVLPDPINISQTISPSFEEFFINIFIRSTGFSVGCTFVPAFILGISRIFFVVIRFISFAFPFRSIKIHS